VSRRLALVEELPETIQEHVRRGELPAHAAMKHLVPFARANPEACERLVAAIAGKGLTNRQIGQLYAVAVLAQAVLECFAFRQQAHVD
jgi:hypothetical protein